MFKSRTLSVLGLLAFSICSRLLAAEEAAAPAGKTLSECFGAALKRSEVVSQQYEFIVQAEAKYRQALGGILPRIDGEASYQRQDRSEASSGRFSRENQYVAKIGASQPLFQGFREFYAMKQTKASGRAETYAWKNAATDLFENVADNFYAIVALETELSDLQNEKVSYEERLRELRQRIRIGRSRQSEALVVEATLANLKAEKADLQGRLLVARELFVFLTDLDHGTPLLDSIELPSQLVPLEEYLQRVELRYDVSAQKERLEASEHAVRYERGAHFPFLGVTGNYYGVNSDTLENPDRDPTWDVKGTMTVPIFTGGTTAAKVRERKSQSRQAQLEYERVMRNGTELVKAHYQLFTSDQERLKALQEATEISKRTYEVQVKDYRMGLVNNLDVLLTLVDYQNRVRELARFRSRAKLNWLLLQTAVVKEPLLPDPAGSP